MTDRHEELAAWLEDQIYGATPPTDILEKAPDLTLDDAHRVQFALVRRRIAKGERLIGYKAGQTSRAIRQQRDSHPLVVCCILSAGLGEEEAPHRLSSGLQTCIQPEVAVLMKRDLRGTGATAIDAAAAIDGAFAAIEIVTPSNRAEKRSLQMGIARAQSKIILGSQFTSLLGVDLRLEGVVASVNGVVVHSATAVEAMGSPINVVAAVANKLAEFGEALKGGTVLLTGSLTSNIPVSAGDEARVEFTRLGGVSARFAR